jgi:hypothetical protein
MGKTRRFRTGPLYKECPSRSRAGPGRSAPPCRRGRCRFPRRAAVWHCERACSQRRRNGRDQPALRCFGFFYGQPGFSERRRVHDLRNWIVGRKINGREWNDRLSGLTLHIPFSHRPGRIEHAHGSSGQLNAIAVPAGQGLRGCHCGRHQPQGARTTRKTRRKTLVEPGS